MKICKKHRFQYNDYLRGCPICKGEESLSEKERKQLQEARRNQVEKQKEGRK